MNSTYQIVTEKILDLLQKNENPWTKPWVTKSLQHQKNLSSLRPYTGLNALLLAMDNKPNDYWLSFKQAQDLGLRLSKGEKSTMIIGWFKPSSKEMNDDGEEVSVKGRGLACRYFRVFNLSQFENVPASLLSKTARPDVPTFETETLDVAESIIAETKALIKFGVEQALYRPGLDVIEMPDRNRFAKSCEFYSTMFHELGHWTGHKTRLNRAELQKANLFNSKNYSQEELCAEMTSVFVCSSLNISNDSTLRNSSAYLQSWMKFLKDNPKAFVIACQQAQKAADLILNKKAGV
jgi:antirestriction protein ArdC